MEKGLKIKILDADRCSAISKIYHYVKSMERDESLYYLPERVFGEEFKVLNIHHSSYEIDAVYGGVHATYLVPAFFVEDISFIEKRTYLDEFKKRIPECKKSDEDICDSFCICAMFGLDEKDVCCIPYEHCKECWESEFKEVITND